MNKTYAYHKPSANGVERIKKLREAFSELHYLIEFTSPFSSRERSIALTHLEDSAMWAIKSIVCNDPESVVE